MKLPQEFIQSIDQHLGQQEVEDFINSLHNAAPVSIRFNPGKIDQSIDTERVPWSEHGYYLSERPLFVADPYWHGGAYYVQEASSMIIGPVIHQLKRKLGDPVRILDLCGAPGGKSTDIMTHLGPEDLLVANEVIKSRAKILYENVVKWGYPNHLVTTNDPKDFERVPGFFDMVVVDAPCSGEGLFRKDPQSLAEWSPENTKLCSQRQERILRDVWDSLAEGGYLVYSTCTYNRQENHDILNWLEENFKINKVEIQLETHWGFMVSEVRQHPIYQAFPHMVKGEGFSFFVIQKASAVSSKKIKVRVKEYDLKDHFLTACKGVYVERDGDVYFLTHPEEMTFLHQNLNMVKPGLHIGTLKKNKLIPSQELANTVFLNQKAFDVLYIDDEEVIKYLKNETFEISGKKGFQLLKYHHLPLGFINHLGNRFNNLYPQSWRIRKQDITEAINII